MKFNININLLIALGNLHIIYCNIYSQYDSFLLFNFVLFIIFYFLINKIKATTIKNIYSI